MSKKISLNRITKWKELKLSTFLVMKDFGTRFVQFDEISVRKELTLTAYLCVEFSAVCHPDNHFFRVLNKEC